MRPADPAPAAAEPARPSPAGASPSRRILELDGLRAFALLAVISFHYTLSNALANPVTALGWVGVDLFFVLSGYLITGILLRSSRRPKYYATFYARRTLRIFPVYYLLLAVYVIVAWIQGGAQPWTYWAMHAAFLSSVAEYFHYWPFAAPVFVYAGVSVLWSLSIEELFYLMWAPLVRMLRPRHLWMVVLGVIVGSPLLRFAIHGRGFREYSFLPARFDSLAWGAALALLGVGPGRKVARLEPLARWAGHRLSLWTALLVPALAGLLVLIVLTGGGRGQLWFATLGYSLLALVFAGVLGWTVTHAGSRAPVCRLLRWEPARYLGRISYTAYLVHYPIFTLLANGRWLGSGAAATAARAAISLALTLAVAGASWRWLEAPILTLKERWAPAARARQGGPASARLCTGPIPPE